MAPTMHGMLNMDGASKFHFDWKDLVPSGLSVKDAIAPTALAFKNSRTFQMGGIFGAVSFLSITASDLSDQLLKDFLDMDSSQIVTMHIQSVDQNKAIKTIKHTITELDRSKIEEQKKAVRAGYDMDVLPSDLATYGRDAKALLKELQSQNERMFLVTFLVLNTGKTEQELENNVFQASSIAQKHNCELCRLDFQQEQGLMSSLPLADCQIEIQRGLTTSSTAIFVPFTTQELFDGSKESLYYGLNALSNNLIIHDKRVLKIISQMLKAGYVQAAQIQYVNSVIMGMAQYLQTSICSHAYHAIDRRVNNAALTVWKKLYPKRYNSMQVPLKVLCNLPDRHKGYDSKTFAVWVEGKWFGITYAFITHSHYEPKPFDQKMTPYTVEGRRRYVSYRAKHKPLPCDRPSVNSPNDIAMSAYAKGRMNFEYYMNREYAYSRDKGKCKCCGNAFSPMLQKNCHHVKNKLPLDRINKVPNLVWLCEPCHRMVHNSPIPPELDAKTVGKIMKYREKLKL